MKLSYDAKALLAAAAALAVLCVLVSLGAALFERNRSLALERHERLLADHFHNQVRDYLNARLGVANIVTNSLALKPPRHREEFAATVTPVLRAYPDILAMNWVLPSGRIEWVVPEDRNAAAQGLDLFSRPGSAPVIAAVRESRAAAATPPTDLAQGGRGYAFYFPVEVAGEIVGYVNLVIRVADLRNAVLADAHAHGALLQASDGDEVLFASNAKVAWHEAAPSQFQMLNRTWYIRFSVREAGLDRAVGVSAMFIYLIGLPLAAVASCAVWLLANRHYWLRRSEERFRDFAESATDWFWEMDRNLRFSFFSGRFEDAAGVSPDELLGKTRREMLDAGAPIVGEPASRTDWEHHLRVLDEHRPFRDFRHQRCRPDGSVGYLAISGKPVFDERGRFTGYRGSGTDITDRFVTELALRAREQQLRRAREQAEAASNAKSQFLANVSHEIRTPLNAILGFSDIMRSEMLGPIGSTKYQEYAHSIFRSGHHLLAIINDVLDLSKIEAGRYELATEPIELRGLLVDCLSVVRHSAEEKSVGLALEVAEIVPALFADRRAVKQITLNLLSNAVKFTPKGGHVVLRTYAEGARCVIAVCDDGIGIPAGEIATLAQPFVQSATRDPHLAMDGTGLGLSIVRSLVELHGGKLTIESAVGQGTTVSVFLPQNRQGELPLQAIA